MSIRNLLYSTGSTLKAVLRDYSTGIERLWNTATVAFEAYNAANIANYGIAVTEGSPGEYSWVIPSTLPAPGSPNVYQATIYRLAGVSLTVGDLSAPVWNEDFAWDTLNATLGYVGGVNGDVIGDVAGSVAGDVLGNLVGRVLGFGAASFFGVGARVQDSLGQIFDSTTFATLGNQTTLLNRISDARAGYLDNLNVGGVVAAASNLPAHFSGLVITSFGNVNVLFAGLSQGGTASTITLNNGASSTDNLYFGNLVRITGGLGAGQTRPITGYNGSTKVATVSPNWVVTPDNTSYSEVFAANAFAGGSTTYIALPLNVSIDPPSIASIVGGITTPLIVFQNASSTVKWKVANADNSQANLSGHTIKMVVHDPNTDVVLQVIVGTLSASDPVNNPSILDTITIVLLPANVPNAGRFNYEIRDYTNDLVYGDGPIQVKWSPKP